MSAYTYELTARGERRVEGVLGDDSLHRSDYAFNTKKDRMRRCLPYGIWRCNDGREVLFNRDYRPIWERRPGGPAKRANPRERVRNIAPGTRYASVDYARGPEILPPPPRDAGEEWFYSDVNVPWRSKVSERRCLAVLAEWGVAMPAYPTAAEFYADFREARP